LFAFAAVSLGVMILRVKDKTRARPFRTPAIWLVAPLSIFGCVVLFVSLNRASQMVFLVWAAIGLVFYFLYGFRKSHVGRGIVDVPEPEAYEGTEPPVPGTR
jgi:APA family basic amino acid/polyamine antiporter